MKSLNLSHSIIVSPCPSTHASVPTVRYLSAATGIHQPNHSTVTSHNTTKRNFTAVAVNNLKINFVLFYFSRGAPTSGSCDQKCAAFSAPVVRILLSTLIQKRSLWGLWPHGKWTHTDKNCPCGLDSPQGQGPQNDRHNYVGFGKVIQVIVGYLIAFLQLPEEGYSYITSRIKTSND